MLTGRLTRAMGPACERAGEIACQATRGYLEQCNKGSRWILSCSDMRALTESYRSALNAFRESAVGQMEHTL
jgi:hypothetical protein